MPEEYAPGHPMSPHWRGPSRPRRQPKLGWRAPGGSTRAGRNPPAEGRAGGRDRPAGSRAGGRDRPASCGPTSATDEGGRPRPGLAEEFEHRFRPLSTLVAVPLFALFSAGVDLGGSGGFLAALTDPVAGGIVVALVLGKPIGILTTTWLVTRIRGIALDPALRWIDLAGVAMLAGIGFTVSLLVTELSFAAGDPHHDHAKVAILLASLISALLASLVLVARNRRYGQIARAEAVDADHDGVPDVYQS